MPFFCSHGNRNAELIKTAMAMMPVIVDIIATPTGTA